MTLVTPSGIHRQYMYSSQNINGRTSFPYSTNAVHPFLPASHAALRAIMKVLSFILFLSLWSQPGFSIALPRDNDVSACKLPAVRNVGGSIGFRASDNRCNVGSTGTIKALMLFVDFPGSVATESARAMYDYFMPQASDWYRNASYGRLTLNVTADTVFRRMPSRADAYGWSRGLTTQLHNKYIQDALAAYNRTISPPVDVLYIVVPPNAKDITSSFTTSSLLSGVTNRGGDLVARSAVTFGSTHFTSWKWKVLNHETGHALCLPDLYPLAEGGGSSIGLYTGGFDLMGPIGGPGPDYFAWNKWRLGWLDDGQVDCVVNKAGSTTTTHVLTALEKQMDKGIKAVVIKGNNTAALVAELRTATGVDAAVCAPGVLLYEISTTIKSGSGPIRVIDATPDSRGCGGHKFNDGVLSMSSLNGTSSFTVPGWGVKVALMNQTADAATIQVTMGG